MANIIEQDEFTADIYKIDPNDAVDATDPNGVANKQAQALANRTKNLKNQIHNIEGIITEPGAATLENMIPIASETLVPGQLLKVSSSGGLMNAGLYFGEAFVNGPVAVVEHNKNIPIENQLVLATMKGFTIMPFRAYPVDSNTLYIEWMYEPRVPAQTISGSFTWMLIDTRV